ncbi:hypothetical protein XI09_21165 [Bradyrhizobium sp. CCBAU 11386]|uniref:hypothetical protein n=1 Tax=Bradyrhizobium sp. CCBAU 11386 TaxID=1630837 RepID=UPI002303E6DC|nr:hypothetical protein [Bradyrhizobium sp. CCBAU 11386]MDA9507092.1 hypothetical protein [Bradyrhizobium sp. CCBAU 11386]
MLAFFRRLLWEAPTPKVQIDQWARWEAWLAEQRKREAVQKKEREADRTRISIVVWSWSRDCVSEWRQLEPPKKVPREVRVWLAGLDVREIVTMARAGDAAVRQHIYGRGELISGLRMVQPLSATTLYFPPRKRKAEGK